jgi:hypothetical protein
MKISNRLGLPQAIVDAVSNDDYDRGEADISVTGLLAPPRQQALLEAHADDLVEDAADRLWSLFGQVGHGILERANGGSVERRLGFFENIATEAERLLEAHKEGELTTSDLWRTLKEMVTWRKSNTYDLVEKRLFLQISGWTISGKFDTLLLDDARILSDYKFTTVWKVKDLQCPPEWEAQINVLAEILITNGIEVKSGRIIALLRDWTKTEAERNPDYPTSQVVPLDVPLWARADRIEFIERKVAEHQAARQSLPLCSDSDRWMKAAKWAVMKEGRARAVKLFNSEGEAMVWMSGQKDSRALSIEHRPSEPQRCKFYCGAAPYCTQWQEDQLGKVQKFIDSDEVL